MNTASPPVYWPRADWSSCLVCAPGKSTNSPSGNQPTPFAENGFGVSSRTAKTFQDCRRHYYNELKGVYLSEPSASLVARRRAMLDAALVREMKLNLFLGEGAHPSDP